MFWLKIVKMGGNSLKVGKIREFAVGKTNIGVNLVDFGEIQNIQRKFSVFWGKLSNIGEKFNTESNSEIQKYKVYSFRLRVTFYLI